MDRRGVLGLPVRITVAFLIVALFIPSAVSAAEYFSESSTITEIHRTADSIISAADDVWYSGTGSSTTIQVDVPAGYSIRIGGDLADAWSYGILKGDEEVGRTYLEAPKIRFIDGPAYVSGTCSLHVTCDRDSDGNYGVRVETV